MPRRPNDPDWMNYFSNSLYNIGPSVGAPGYGGGGGEGGPKGLNIEALTPKEIVEELDKTVIGNDVAKQLIAIAAYNRLVSHRNLVEGKKGDDFFFEKNNILLMGNTGCGKTHMMRALSSITGLPVIIEDATVFTAAGYVGKDVDKVMTDLANEAGNVFNKYYSLDNTMHYRRARYVKELTEYGIIYIDEFDKIRSSQQEYGRDVGGRAVQEAFLKLVEGTEITVQGVTYKTDNILFVFGGAFSGIDEIVRQRLNKKSMGFTASVDQEERAALMKEASIEDFTRFGIIPELLGRLSTVAVLDEMTHSMIYKIFTEPRRSILSQVTAEFKSSGIELSFSDEAIEYIVEEAYKLKLGARGLKGVCQKLLRPLYYYLPSVKAVNGPVVVTKQMLLNLENVSDVDGD